MTATVAMNVTPAPEKKATDVGVNVSFVAVTPIATSVKATVKPPRKRLDRRSTAESYIQVPTENGQNTLTLTCVRQAASRIHWSTRLVSWATGTTSDPSGRPVSDRPLRPS